MGTDSQPFPFTAKTQQHHLYDRETAFDWLCDLVQPQTSQIRTPISEPLPRLNRILPQTFLDFILNIS
jgi:hypothetical protein